MPRASDTPFQSGVRTRWAGGTSGSWSIGKNMPLKRNSGRDDEPIDDRERWSVRRVAVKAVMGSANASPVRTATGIIAMPRTMSVAPNTTDHDHERGAHEREPDDRTRGQAEHHVRAAMGVRDHRLERPVPGDGGHDGIHRFACGGLHRLRGQQARGQEHEVAHALQCRRLSASSTNVPRPRPMAGRNSTGARNVVNSPPRHVRRYTSSWCSSTRTWSAVTAVTRRACGR